MACCVLLSDDVTSKIAKCHLNFIENLPILGLYYGNAMNDAELCLGMLARSMLNARSEQYENLSQLRSWLSRSSYPIFKVYRNIMCNSAGKFSTNVETTIFSMRFQFSNTSPELH